MLNNFITKNLKKKLNGTHGDVTVDTGIAGSAQACVVVVARLVLAHCTLGASVVVAVGLLLLAIDAGVANRALASVALRQVEASGAVVARLRGALVDVDLAASAGESSWTDALDPVAHWHAEAAVLAYLVGALHHLALLTSNGARAISEGVRRTLDASGRAVLRLIEVLGTLGARGEPGAGVHAWRALGLTAILARCGRLIGERTGWTGLTVLVAAGRRLAGVAVTRTLEARHQTRWRVGAIAADWHAVVDALGALLPGVSAEGATETGALTIAVLIVSFRAEGALLLLLASERAGWTVDCGHINHYLIIIFFFLCVYN